MPILTNWIYRLAKATIDIGVLLLSYCVAFVARFEANIPPEWLTVLIASLPVVLIVRFSALEWVGVQMLSWRAVSLREIHRIFYAVALGTIVLTFLRIVCERFAAMYPILSLFTLPYGVLGIDFALCSLGLIGLRVVWRTNMERKARRQLPTSITPLRAILIGTNLTSVQVVRHLSSGGQGIDLVGLVAEYRSVVGMSVYGLPVLGMIDDLKQIAEKFEIQQAIIDFSSDGGHLRTLVQLCERCGLQPRVLVENDDEKPGLARLRQVNVEDLLRRPPVRLDSDDVKQLLHDRAVVVTGAGGSIGSQLCREICRHKPARLVLVEQAENNLFNIHRQLSREFPRMLLEPKIADICDTARMEGIFTRFKPDILFHAAAHKHVPMMEWNVREAIVNNVMGTVGLADLASQFGIGHFVMVSTDKAVRPTSVMGVSKRTAELYVQALASETSTRFVTVRFGNVLGSSGSVVPIFQEQIARGGPVMVTHPEMKRYFMTIAEACQLILEAGALGKGGEIFILDMGQPVKIVDLANDMIRLNGLTPGVDIEVQFSGIRPGEKLYEEISLAEENAGRTRHPRIYIGQRTAQDLPQLREAIQELAALADCGDYEKMRDKFKELVPKYAYEPTNKDRVRSAKDTKPELTTTMP